MEWGGRSVGVGEGGGVVRSGLCLPSFPTVLVATDGVLQDDFAGWGAGDRLGASTR